MFHSIEKLLYRRYILHTKKFAHIRELNVRSYIHSIHTVHKIHLILKKEILLNKKLYVLLQKETFPEELQTNFVQDACRILLKINAILIKEDAILSKTNLFQYITQDLFTKKENAFHRQLKHFHILAEKELELHHDLFLLTQKIAKHRLNQDKVRRSWKLVQDLQQELRILGKSIGNSALVQKHGEHVLLRIEKIKKTEIYDFVQQDVKYIQTKVEYIMAHPKEHKLTYFLTTVYIVAPFTFEMTGIILFFRYIGKYTLTKTKKLKQKLIQKKHL